VRETVNGAFGQERKKKNTIQDLWFANASGVGLINMDEIQTLMTGHYLHIYEELNL